MTSYPQVYAASPNFGICDTIPESLTMTPFLKSPGCLYDRYTFTNTYKIDMNDFKKSSYFDLLLLIDNKNRRDICTDE